jgi:hypothetical protein
MHFSKILEVLFIKQLCRGRSVIENSFCILKKKLLLKTNLHVLFLLDGVVCCWILYNMILGGKDFDMDTLLTQLELENFVNRIDVHG